MSSMVDVLQPVTNLHHLEWDGIADMPLLMMQVTVFSTSEYKKEEALKTLGADHFIVSKNEDAMKVSCSVALPSYAVLTLPFNACVSQCQSFYALTAQHQQ